MRGRIQSLWYWALFAVESAGMVFILYVGVPVYRKFFDLTEHRPGRAIIVPTLCVVAVMQVCYWIKLGMRPSPAKARHLLLGHLLLFFSRLSFIFAGSLFSLVLFRRFEDVQKSFSSATVLFLGTFAQFCYSRELEALARRAEGSSEADSHL